MLPLQTSNESNAQSDRPATGNASNPDPVSDNVQPSKENRFLGSGAEKYLREVASIEDVPDAQDNADMDKVIQENKNRD